MAKVYISEYGGPAWNGQQIALEPPIVPDYSVSLTTLPATSTVAFDNATQYIRVHTDAICSIAIVASTTSGAAITNKRMAADQTEYFGVKSGGHFSAISNS